MTNKGNIDRSLIGKRFGKLTVLDFEHMGANSSSYCLCECDCGNKTIVMRKILHTGHTTSCGCMSHERAISELTGKRFGRLTVLNFDHMDERSRTYWLCECDCGNRIIIRRNNLITGHTSSCGCYNLDRIRECQMTHGLCGSRLYNIWQNMLARCNNSNNTHYDRYGGRGITVCNEWNEFENFRDWALSHGYDQDLTLDRENNNYGYCPDNCRWVERVIQSNNTSQNRVITYDNETHTMAEWARLLNVNYVTLRSRINRGNMRDFEEYFGH